MKTLSFEELVTTNGGSEISDAIVKFLSILFYSEAKRVMDATSEGGNAAAVVAFK